MYPTSIGWINKPDRLPCPDGNGALLEFGYSHVYFIARPLAVGATTRTEHERAKPNHGNPYQQPIKAPDRVSHGKTPPCCYTLKSAIS
jgi:hypothetical protein